jgi:uncharacterized cupin superfamily protein
MSVAEAPLRRDASGLVPAGPGWFVVNVRDAAWLANDALGARCVFESPDARFEELGIRVGVVWPGQPSTMYHAEESQEDFLVLAGECLLVVEEEERRLGAWDFVHCPPGTRHTFVGAGDGPCALLMVGRRDEGGGIRYPVSEAAGRHGAAVARETPSPNEAYAALPGWRLERPDLSGLPWA